MVVASLSEVMLRMAHTWKKALMTSQAFPLQRRTKVQYMKEQGLEVAEEALGQKEAATALVSSVTLKSWILSGLEGKSVSAVRSIS